MSETILHMNNINKSFPGVRALQNVNLEIKKGEVHALLGENGAGKSTLMKILTGVYTPDSGTMTFKGEPLDINHPKQAQDIGIGIVYQEFNLLPDLTVAQNICIGREPQLRLKGFIHETRLNREATLVLEKLNVNLDVRQPVSQLTVAQQQMVEIAKALSFNCELLIMDEPTAALTEAEIDELFKVILDLKTKGVSIIYISHRLEELKRIVDRVTVLRDGQSVATHQFTDVTVDQLIKEMVGRNLASKFPPKPPYRREKMILDVRSMNRSDVLKNISFQVYEGEILGIAGLMGAGRTELARAMFGADKIDSGEIVVDGRAVHLKNPSDAIHAGIGYITEDRKKDGLALSLDVKNNISLASYRKVSNRLGFIRSSAEKEVAKNYIERLKIKTPSMNQIVKFLSGGNQQKIVLAKWLFQQAKILIFDEPTRGIDVGAKVEVYELIYELVQNGVAVIVISSELPEILGLSDRILVMAEGKITADLSKSEATQEKILAFATGAHAS